MIYCIYFVCINEFLKIYLVTSLPDVTGSWSDEGCTVSKTQEYEGFKTSELCLFLFTCTEMVYLILFDELKLLAH